jgi:hypothetical protein
MSIFNRFEFNWIGHCAATDVCWGWFSDLERDKEHRRLASVNRTYFNPEIYTFWTPPGQMRRGKLITFKSHFSRSASTVRRIEAKKVRNGYEVVSTGGYHARLLDVWPNFESDFLSNYTFYILSSEKTS